MPAMGLNFSCHLHKILAYSMSFSCTKFHRMAIISWVESNCVSNTNTNCYLEEIVEMFCRLIYFLLVHVIGEWALFFPYSLTIGNQFLYSIWWFLLAVGNFGIKKAEQHPLTTCENMLAAASRSVETSVCNCASLSHCSWMACLYLLSYFHQWDSLHRH